MSDIASKTIIIAGASSGIGAATALTLAKQKHNLILAARRLDKLEQVATKCRAAGAQVITLQCDVSQREDVDRLVATTLEKFPRLDVMLANAGYGFLAKIHETTDQQFDDIV